jgi:hypothetical protein
MIIGIKLGKCNKIIVWKLQNFSPISRAVIPKDPEFYIVKRYGIL